MFLHVGGIDLQFDNKNNNDDDCDDAYSKDKNLLLCFLSGGKKLYFLYSS